MQTASEFFHEGILLKTGELLYFLARLFIYLNTFYLKNYSASTASPSKVKVIGTEDPFGDTRT